MFDCEGYAFSNLFIFPFRYGGRNWDCVLHAYLYYKLRHFNDCITQWHERWDNEHLSDDKIYKFYDLADITKQTSSAELVTLWDIGRERLMKQLLKVKFASPALGGMLLATGSKLMLIFQVLCTSLVILPLSHLPAT